MRTLLRAGALVICALLLVLLSGCGSDASDETDVDQPVTTVSEEEPLVPIVEVEDADPTDASGGRLGRLMVEDMVVCLRDGDAEVVSSSLKSTPEEKAYRAVAFGPNGTKIEISSHIEGDRAEGYLRDMVQTFALSGELYLNRERRAAIELNLSSEGGNDPPAPDQPVDAQDRALAFECTKSVLPDDIQES